MKTQKDSIYGIDDEVEEEVRLPITKIKKTSLPKGSEKIKLDNVVTVSEAALAKILSNTESATRKIAGAILNHGVPAVLSYDNATSYVEAVLRDGLNIDVTIDDDVLKIVDSLNKLSMAYMYSRMVKLPKSIRKKYIETLTVKFVDEAMLEMKKSSNTRKYSQNLRELVATVKSKSDSPEETKSKLGVKRSKK